jgi:hypothetical protein
VFEGTTVVNRNKSNRSRERIVRIDEISCPSDEEARMFNRWSMLMLIVGAAIGYGVAAPPAGAQAEPVPFAVGDRVTLRLEAYAEDGGSRTFSCAVGQIQGNWVRCDSTDPFRPRQSESWYSIKALLHVQKTPR